MSVRIETSCEQCVWVNAGVLNYKLCDRAFDCEHCPLDAALRDRASGYSEDDSDLSFTSVDLPAWQDIAPEIEALLEPLRSLTLCDTARYSSRHIWVRQLPTGMLHLGLDAFAAALLPEDAQLVTVANHSELREGEAFGWVYAWNKTLPLPAPVSGLVVCRNGGHLDSISKLRGSPYREGVLLTIRPTIGTLATAKVCAARTQAARIRRNCHSLADRLTKTLAKPELGLCLNDGGVAVTSLPQLLGPERYWKLLCQYIGGE
jgi:glycine cleavage system H lipoate-binding protein